MDAIFEAMKHNTQDISAQQKAIYVLKNCSCHESARDLIVSKMDDFIPTFVSILKKHVGNAEIQHYGFSAIKNLALSDSISSNFATYEGIRALLVGCKKHRNNPGVLTNGCSALKNLCRDNKENSKEVVKNKGIIAILAIMKYYPNEIKLLQEACGTLLNLSKDHSADIGNQGGIESIICVMKKHPDQTDLQSCTMAVLWSLAAVKSNQIIIYQNDGLKAIVTAMTNHTTSLKVQQKGCLALTSMAFSSDTFREKIASDGGIQATIQAMDLHAQDVHLQKYACKFLASMLQNSIYKKSIVKHISSVKRSIKYHPNNADVKKYANKILQVAKTPMKKESKVKESQSMGFTSIVDA